MKLTTHDQAFLHLVRVRIDPDDEQEHIDGLKALLHEAVTECGVLKACNNRQVNVILVLLFMIIGIVVVWLLV